MMKLNHFFKFLFCCLIIFLNIFSFSDENLKNKVKKITLELRCMTCQNQSIHDSDSDYANDIKKLVEEKLNEGLSEKEIKHFLTERYGEYILFKPYFNSKNILLWLFPFVLLFFSAVYFIRNLIKN